jgi:hypothetical protein
MSMITPARWRMPIAAGHELGPASGTPQVVEALNGWIGQMFNRTNINATVAALLDSQAGQRKSGGRDVAKRRLLDAEARIRRF